MGKKKTVVPQEIEDIETEARETFDLGEFLRSRSMREKEVRLYTDEPLAEEIGGYEVVKVQGEFGLQRDSIRAWGITGEIARLTKEDAERAEDDERSNAAAIKRLTKKVETLAQQLEDSSIEIKLRAVPKEVESNVRRKVRTQQNLTGLKSLRPDQEELFNSEFDVRLLTKMIVTVKQGENVNEGASSGTIEAMRGFLPSSEWGKLLRAVAELQWENVIASQAVQNADF